MLTKLCCFRLNTAAMIIGWLGGVGSLIGLAIVSVVLAKANEFTEMISSAVMGYTEVTKEDIQTWLTIICVIYLVVCAINLVTSSLLILGTVKERHLLLLPWLINSGFSLVISIIYYVVVHILKISYGVSFGQVVSSFIFSSLLTALHFFIWYAMYSHFKQLRAAREQQGLSPPTKTPLGPTYVKF